MASRFLDLPRELVIQILSLLALHELLSCKRINRLLNEIVEGSVLLQYLVETEAAGVQDNPQCNLTMAERFHKLQRREEAWTHFRTSFTIAVPVRNSTSGIYDLSGRVCLLGSASPFDRSVTTAVNFLRLPASCDRPRWSEISFEDTDRRIIDVGLAVQEHDLIAFVTSSPQARGAGRAVDILLMNLSTGTHHTQAQQPVIRVTSTTDDITLNLEIVGDHLALLVIFASGDATVRDRLYIYDWKSGRLNMTLSADQNTYFSFAFLSEDVLLLANTHKACFDLCRLSPVGDNVTPLTISRCLSLPKLAPNCHILRILCRSDPNHIGTFPPSGPYSQVPFYTSAEDALVLFDISILTLRPTHDVRSCSFVVHRRALLAHLSPPFSFPPFRTPWSRWGPPVTRWFDTDDVTTRWITTTHGQRWVLTTSDAPSVPCPLRVLDFNPYVVRRVKASRESSVLSENDQPLVVENDDTLPLGPFSEAVAGRLPYVECMSNENYDYDAVLIDEQSLIGMKLNDDRDMVNLIDILHFG